MSVASKMYLEYCAEMSTKISDGEENTLPFYFEIGEMINELEAVKEQLLPYVTTEADRYDKTQLKEMGINYQPDGRGTHDYSHLSEWLELKAKIKNFEEFAKVNKLTVVKYSKPILSKLNSK